MVIFVHLNDCLQFMYCLVVNSMYIGHDSFTTDM